MVMILTSSVDTLSLASLTEQLAAKMWPLRNTRATIVASTPASVPLARELAAHLDVAWDKQYCKAVEHPGNPRLTIGSITSDNVLIHDNAARLPQDYIEHQVHLMKRLVAGPASDRVTSDGGKTFVIVHRQINATDDVLALVESLRKLRPEKIFIATPAITREAHHELESYVDRVLCLAHHNGRNQGRKLKMHRSLIADEVNVI